MLTFEKFMGINNVLPQERMGESDLVTATNVDIGLSGELRRRGGFTLLSSQCHKSLHQSEGYMLAVVDGGDLVAIYPDGSRVVVYPSLGPDRVHYCNLPGGRTAFSNGLICGMTSGGPATQWGVPTPEGTGYALPIAGKLAPGLYQYRISYTRMSDGLEGAPLAAEPLQLDEGGIFIDALPVRDGHTINVYLSGHGGEGAYLAGSTSTPMFSYIGENSALVQPCRTVGTHPAPAGKAMAFWNSRVLVADGPVLWASMPGAWHLFELRRDFKQFTAPITLVQPVDDGVYVGTEQELAFLGGPDFDKLAFRQVVPGRVVPGSGAAAPGDKITLGQNVGSGSAMLCIVDGGIVAGFNGGQVARLTQGRYRTDAAEVVATFRVLDGIPQYMAVVQ